MYPVKALFILSVAHILIYNVHALLVDIPLPKELKECLKRETENNKITEVPGEMINNLCVDTFLLKSTQSKSFEPTQEDIDLVNSILKRYLQKERRLKRQVGHVKWRRRKPKRKELRRLSKKERKRLLDGLNAIKKNGVYDSFAAIHRGESRLLRAHRGGNFFGWHRILIKGLELSLQDYNRRITLPYWDSTMDFDVYRPENSVLWTDDFFGPCRGDVTTGPFANWKLGLDPKETLFRNCGSGGALFTKEGIRNILLADYHANITDVSNIPQYFEGHHDAIHVWVDGWVRLLYAAAEDPVFFFHHCFVDYIWHIFRKRLKLRGINPELDYPQTLDNPLHWGNATMDPFHFATNADGYSDAWEADYEDMPSCSRKSRRNCRSPLLTCNLQSERCETRVVEHLAVEQPSFLAKAVSSEFGGTSAVGGTLTLNAPSQQKQKTLPAGMVFKTPFVDRRTASVNPLPQEKPETVPVTGRSKRSISLDFNFGKEKSYQNSFMLDGVADTSLWAFFPVNIIYQRPPGMLYSSKIVTRGRKVPLVDIYSPSYYQNLTKRLSTSALATNKRCDPSGTGATTIYFQSQGIDYNGFYKDYVIVDGKQAITSSIGYLAMKNPGNKSAEAYLSAYDSCGRLCRPTCQVKGTQPPKYMPCSGSVRISPEVPKMFGTDYGEAVSLLWNLDKGRDVPSINHDEVFITFYCDYQLTWPWEL